MQTRQHHTTPHTFGPHLANSRALGVYLYLYLYTSDRW